jgi:glycosyltransferase involved in cell wall biosynthesis
MNRPAIAFLFRYGPAEHAELFHAMPAIWETLSRTCTVHCFGMRTAKPVPPEILAHVVWHPLPFRVNRQSGLSKLAKTALWLAALPSVARQCRALGVRAVYIDETIPLTASAALRHFGPNVAVTVADMFTDIYFRGPLAPLGRALLRADLRAWRRLPLIFTRARATRDWLASNGVDPARVRPVYDPCDFSLYHPPSPADHASARAAFGYAPTDVVLAHHGIAHPNKGNDRILRWLAPLLPDHPELKFLLIGDGPELPRLRRLADTLGIASACTFTGWLPGPRDVSRALGAADIGLVMRTGARSDDFHMTGALVHSMACGLPVLAAHLAGVAEVVAPDRNGLLFPPADGPAFQTALLRLTADPALRDTLGATAHADALRLFDLPSVVSSTVSPLLELAAL